MQFNTKLGLVDIPNSDVLNAARDIAQNGAERVPALMNRIVELEELLRSARCIAQRKGETTAWERFDVAIAKLGVGSITARVYKLLPDDPQDTPNPLRKALESARDELKRQRECWTGSKNDSWAVAAIDTELGRIERALA